MNWKLFAAVSTLTGTVAGAGFLGMPYVIAKSGFIIGFFQIIIIGLIILAVKLYFGEVILRTKTKHQLPGYTKIYLGSFAQKLAYFSMIFGVYAALAAYLVGEGSSLSFLFTGTTQYAIYFSIGFWLILTSFVYHGIRALKKGEIIGIIFVSIILFLILLFFLPKVNVENVLTHDFSSFFLPFGVIIFAFLGFTAIPEMSFVLKKDKKLLKKAIILGIIIPIIIYCIFSFVVVGYKGVETPEIATLGLGRVFVILGIFTMFTAFFAVSIAMRDMYYFDLKYKKINSWLLACVVPLVLFLIIHFFKLASFTKILSYGGAIGGGIAGILIVLMAHRAKKLSKTKPAYDIKINWFIIILMILFFIAAIVSQFF